MRGWCLQGNEVQGTEEQNQQANRNLKNARLKPTHAINVIKNKWTQHSDKLEGILDLKRETQLHVF